MPYKIISAIGDSITQGAFDTLRGLGWFGRLTEKVAARSLSTGGNTFCSNNMSMSGDRVCDASHRFAAEAMTRDIGVLIIAIGVNDLVRSPAPDSPTDMSQHLRIECWNNLLDLAQANIPQIVVLDILPVREELMGFKDWVGMPVYWFNKDIKEYNDLIAKICADRGVPFIRRFDKWEKRNPAELYADYAHPNGAGHQLIADEVYAELEKLGIL